MESYQKVIHLDNTPRDIFEIMLKHIESVLMKQQKDAEDSLLDEDSRQHRVDKYDDTDLDLINTILHGNHDPHAPTFNKLNHIILRLPHKKGMLFYHVE